MCNVFFYVGLLCNVNLLKLIKIRQILVNLLLLLGLFFVGLIQRIYNAFFYVGLICNVMLFSKLYKENNMISFKQKEFSTEIIIIMKLLQI